MSGGQAEGSGLRLFAPGALTDPAWIAARCDDTARMYGSQDRSVAATLWWYSSSLVLLQPAVRMLAMTGRSIDLAPDQLTVSLTAWGLLERVSPSGFIDPGAATFGQHLDAALGPVIEVLSDVGRVPRQRLAALLSDSLGNRLIAEDRTDLAPSIAAASELVHPEPRFVVLAGRTFLRRASCCLIFRLPGQALCVSCPRQAPDERSARLEKYVRGG